MFFSRNSLEKRQFNYVSASLDKSFCFKRTKKLQMNHGEFDQIKNIYENLLLSVKLQIDHSFVAKQEN